MLRMRIALIAPFGLRAKGTARARALPLAQALAHRGHTVALFVPPYDSPADAGRRWNDNGVDIINAPLPNAQLLPPARRAVASSDALWHLRLARHLLLCVRGWQPEIAHIFKPKGPSGLVGLALWQGRRMSGHGRPRIVVDADDWEGPGGWNDDPRAGYSTLQRRFFAWQERYGLSHADAWTVASECLRRRAIGFGAERARVFHLPNGVGGMAEGWTIEDSKRRLGGQVALLYTRFAGVNPEAVRAIWHAVTAQVPQARLIVVGQGIAGEERSLSGLTGCDVAGWLEPAAMQERFAEAGVAIVPWSNTFSNQARHSAKVLELMAAGLPIVAYGVGELPSTLGDGGLLVPPGDASAFARSVVELLNDPDRAAKLGAAGRARVCAFYRWDTLAETALRAYGAAGVT